MEFDLAHIAALLGGDIQGDPEARINDLARIETAQKGSLTFFAEARYESFLYTTQATAVLVPRDFQPDKPIRAALLRVDDPRQAFTTLLQTAAELNHQRRQGREQPSFVHERAEVDENTYIGAFAYVGSEAKLESGVQIWPGAYIGDRVKVGADTVIFPGAILYAGTEVGARCIVHAGAVIGADGFGFVPQADGSFQKTPQLGNVIIGDDVEIGANACIDRATLGRTEIEDGVKIDNLVQIAHNVAIGNHTAIAAQAGVAGSTRIEENCMIGGQAGIVGHLHIAPRTRIDAQSGVNRSITEPDGMFRGSPAQAYRDQLRSEVMFRRLAELEARLRQLEKTDGA